MEAIIITAMLVIAYIGLSWGGCKFIEFCGSLIEKKRKKDYPSFWVWLEECNEAGQEECRWHNTQIAPLKNKVDAILREWNYYSTETRIQKEAELENLRKAIESADAVYREMHNKTEAIRDKIHNYVEQNNLKWAKRWGW